MADTQSRHEDSRPTPPEMARAAGDHCSQASAAEAGSMHADEASDLQPHM